MTPAEAAVALGISRSRVYALIEQGRLKASRHGKILWIEPDALEAVRVRRPGNPNKVRKPR